MNYESVQNIDESRSELKALRVETNGKASLDDVECKEQNVHSECRAMCSIHNAILPRCR